MFQQRSNSTPQSSRGMELPPPSQSHPPQQNLQYGKLYFGFALFKTGVKIASYCPIKCNQTPMSLIPEDANSQDLLCLLYVACRYSLSLICPPFWTFLLVDSAADSTQLKKISVEFTTSKTPTWAQLRALLLNCCASLASLSFSVTLHELSASITSSVKQDLSLLFSSTWGHDPW